MKFCKANKNEQTGAIPLEATIGGNVYHNRGHILPKKEGRIWYECDIDYQHGSRRDNPKRLFYSNDGLLFYSTTHLEGDVAVYWIK